MGGEKKRGQHYVWREYLTAWATDGKVWCQRDGKRFHTNPDNIANELDFYRLKDLTRGDLEFIEAVVIERTAAHIRDIARAWIAPFCELFELKRAYEARGAHIAGFEDRLDIAINNMEENLHARIEGHAVRHLAALRNGDSSVLDDREEFFKFTCFIAAQFIRTPGLMRRMTDTFGCRLGVNIDAVWGLMRTILWTNMGFAMSARRKTVRMTFLDSDPGTEFITGDQPIWNVRAIGLVPGAEPKELELYYPVSPRRALLLAFDAPDRQAHRKALSKAETDAYNGMIVALSDQQTYASTEAALLHIPPTKGVLGSTSGERDAL